MRDFAKLKEAFDGAEFFDVPDELNVDAGKGRIEIVLKIKPELFFKVPDRNMTGSSLLNDRHGTLFHFNGVEAAGDWQNLAMAMRCSHDVGVTWTRPEIIEPEHMRQKAIEFIKSNPYGITAESERS